MGCGVSSSHVDAEATPSPAGMPVMSSVSMGGAVRRSPRANGANLPLTVPTTCVFGSKITMAGLADARKQYWETRVGGHMPIWQALQAASEAILAKDIQFATTLLEASNVKLPTGSLELCYDETGYEYSVPVFCYVHPSDVSETDEKTSTNSGSDRKPVGKGKPLPCVRVRINPGDYNVKLLDKLTTANTVLELKTCIFEETSADQTLKPDGEEDSMNTSSLGRLPPVCAVDRQRVMFVGKELKNGDTLGKVGIDTTRVVQVFLRPAPQVAKVALF